MCKEDWEASEPANPLQDTSSGNSGTGGTGGSQGGTSDTTGTGTPSACTAPTVTAQLREETGKYKISYTVTGCGSITRFIVYLKSPIAPDYVIVSNGYAANGQAVSDDPEITAAASYTEVCVEISGLARCFPKT